MLDNSIDVWRDLRKREWKLKLQRPELSSVSLELALGPAREEIERDIHQGMDCGSGFILDYWQRR